MGEVYRDVGERRRGRRRDGRVGEFDREGGNRKMAGGGGGRETLVNITFASRER